MKTVVIASNNEHKVQEIRQILAIDGWEFKTLREMGVESDPEENAETFAGNARIKALAAHEACGGLAALADDSGIEVDALDGAPGVHSARYAGGHGEEANAANNAKLLANLAEVPDEERTGRFVCALCFVDEDGRELATRGTVEGRIAHGLRGEHGFGYDPLFLPDELGGKVTFGEVDPVVKDGISHRGRALHALREMILADGV